MEEMDGRLERGKEGTVVFLPAEYIPAEQNLETIGYFSAGYKRKYPTDKQRSKVVTLNHDRRVEIIPTAKYGYPNSEDFDFYRAFMKICDEQTIIVERHKNGHRTLHPHLKLPIFFSTTQLIRYAGYVKNDHTWKDAQDWVNRGVLTGIKGGIYEAKTGRLKEGFTTTPFREACVRGEEMHNGKIADMSYVWPAPWFLSNYYYHYFRRVDLAFHHRLHMAIAKTLYPILDTGWYAARGKPYAKRYADLCMILFIPAHKKLSLVKQQLDPSHRELRREGFLAAWEYLLDRHGKWTGVILWWPGPKWFYDQEQRKLRKELAERIDRSPIIFVVPSSPKEAKALPYQPACATADRPSPSPASLSFGSSFDPAQDPYAEMAEGFHKKQGQPQVSRQKVEKEAKILANLEGEGFSREQITLGMEWILRHPEKFNGEVYSLRLLPEVMGQALKEAKQVERAQEKKQQQDGEERRLREEQARRVAVEELYQSLPAEEQASLREMAVESLIQQGIKKPFLVEPAVRSQIYRLLGERCAGDAAL